MIFFVYINKCASIEVGINLCSGYISMTEKLLNCPKVCSILNHMRSERVAENVRFYIFLYSTPFRYYDIFKEHGTYLFSIQVVASDAKPVVVKVLFTWNGIWNKFEAKKHDE